MNKPYKSFDVNECKIQASILLKSLDSQDMSLFKQAVKRFQRLPELAPFSLTEPSPVKIQRKHALAVIALEKGFKSWTDLKCQSPFIQGGFLNKWFVNYPEAKAHLQINGGFLLPYRNHFFICDANYIKNLGLNPEDADWQLIGYDWNTPNHLEAWQRLYKKWMKIQQNRLDKK